MIRKALSIFFLSGLIFPGAVLFGPIGSAGAGEIIFSAMAADRSGRLSFPSGPLQTMTSTPFTLEILDASGTGITGAKVSCALTMPAMPMPENRPRVVAGEDLYRGEAVFTMAGAWRMTCTIVSPSGPVTTLTFDIPEVRLK